MRRFIHEPFVNKYQEDTVKYQENEEEEDTVGTNTLSPLQIKQSRMTAGLCELLTDYNLVHFIPVNIEDGEVYICDSVCMCNNVYLYVIVYAVYVYMRWCMYM